MEAFVHLSKNLFTSYTYRPPPSSSHEDDPSLPPLFEFNLESLIETLNIFTLTDPATSKRDYDPFTSHRLARHANLPVLAITGICTFTYVGEGSPLSIHMSDNGVTTTCDLTTYEAESLEEIPFARDRLLLKTILRAPALLEAITELGAMSPAELIITANPQTRNAGSATVSFSAVGALGDATVEFNAGTTTENPILETFHCSARTSASFKFGLIKAAQRAMAVANKVSLRLDEDGVLSLQFLIEVDTGGGAEDGVAFVDFRVVPLVEEEERTGIHRSTLR